MFSLGRTRLLTHALRGPAAAATSLSYFARHHMPVEAPLVPQARCTRLLYSTPAAPAASTAVRAPLTSAPRRWMQQSVLTSEKTKVIDVMQQRPRSAYTILPTATLQDAARLMLQSKVGCLVVVDPDTQKLIGVLSERDYLKTSEEEVSQQTPVKDIMTPRDRVAFINHDDTLAHVMNVISAKNVRHLPVWNADNPVGQKLLGVISIRDVVNRLVKEHDDLVSQLQEYIAGSY